MNKTEVLKTAETLASQSPEVQSPAGTVGKDEVEAIYKNRKNFLEEIRSLVCLKFYNDIGEKLENEKRQFQLLLNWRDARDEALSHYSFVLNPYYFEQKFLAAEV
jgi:hypothetical protein